MANFLTPFLIVLIASMLSRFSYQMARSPVLPRFAQELGSSPELIGLIVAASTITGILVKLPAGAISDILGRRRMMLLGALFFAGPPFLYPLVTEPLALILVRFLHGFATAIFGPVTSAYVAEIFNKGRAEKLGWFSSANDVGASLGPMIGGFILILHCQLFSDFSGCWRTGSASPHHGSAPAARRKNTGGTNEQAVSMGRIQEGYP